MSTPPPLPTNIPPLPATPRIPQTAPSKASPFVRIFWISFGTLAGLFLVWLVFAIISFTHWRNKPQAPTGTDFFLAASRNLRAGGPVASGNTEEAKKLAGDMSILLQEIRNAGFEQAKKKSVLDKTDGFRTYCEVREGQYVFLVHIPE